MIYVFWICIVLLSVYMMLQVFLLASLWFTPSDVPAKVVYDEDMPAVSILLAARNEEANIERCLRALDALNYPGQKLQVLIGNDHSDDRTREIAATFIAGKSKFILADIEKPLGKARGKANVLAQLAHKATGEFYFIVDADIAVQPNWVKEMVTHFDSQQMGIVSGTTVVEDKGLAGNMQGIDWTFFMGMLKAFANIGVQCTAVGNNMAIRRQAYWDTGGYENLDFSITEDYKLFEAVRKKGWRTKNILTVETTNRSVSIKGLKNLMHQRKRWLMGGRELPFYWWLIFGVFGLFFPAAVALAFFNLKLTSLLYAIKIILQTATVYVLQRKMNRPMQWGYTLLYEGYTILISFITQVFFFMPVKPIWKKRTY